MKYGTLVAFIHAGAIAFGVLMEKITRENAAGETTEYVIEMGDAQKTRVTITDEDNIAELDTDYPSLISDYIGKLHKHSAMFNIAKNRAFEIANPPIPDEGASDVPVAVPPAVGNGDF